MANENQLAAEGCMAIEYSVETCKELQAQFEASKLHRPLRLDRYDPGDELSYEITGVYPAHKGQVKLRIEKFVGGGFAGQVYQVRILEIDWADGEVASLTVDKLFAMKILIPPSGGSVVFRNLVYAIGFQGPFQLQTNPAAARAGALWQKFIRRGAQIRFGDTAAVNDILSTFVDGTLGSCGELSDWVDGRTWRLEVDDRLDLLKKWQKGRAVDESKLGSPEYRAKRTFMIDFVKLLHDMGAHEFARQYEWSTCKSQPNCLKLNEFDNQPDKGLIAVDFRAGLALLPFLPMSPGDFKLIGKGLARGSLVQFDRGDLDKLRKFVAEHREQFADLDGAIDELETVEDIYRNSLPDVTHNHVRLLYSGKLWGTIFDSAVTGWRVRNIIDDENEKKLRGSKLKTLMFFVLGLIPLLGTFLRKVWGRADWRRHYGSLLLNLDYFKQAIRGRIAEKLIVWHRAGRVTEERARKLLGKPKHFLGHLLISFLPVGLHRMFTDGKFAREKLHYIFVRPAKLYFDADLREQWLRDMVTAGKKNHLITDEDADIILGQLKEPYIQKYLKSLAVHVCTLPVTQVVSVFVAIWYKVANNLSWGDAWGEMLLILAGFQVTPISPGSLCRGFYVLYMVIKERNFKDYNIAVFLGFFKYVGYLAFPIQMAYRYPVLARFMAGHWATEAVHIVPVFGEKGALLEHGVFGAFYNYPLTLRKRLEARAVKRANIPSRCSQVVLLSLLSAGVFVLAANLLKNNEGGLPSLKDMWYLSLFVPLISGALVTRFAGGMTLGRRIASAALTGVLSGLIYGIYNLMQTGSAKSLLWGFFVFAIFSAISAVIDEMRHYPKLDD